MGMASVTNSDPDEEQSTPDWECECSECLGCCAPYDDRELGEAGA